MADSPKKLTGFGFRNDDSETWYVQLDNFLILAILVMIFI